MGLNLMDIDMLKEVSNIGTGNASTSLSSMLNKRVSMQVPVVKTPEFKNLASHMGSAEGLDGADSLIAGLLVTITGDVDGMIMYLMSEKSACNLSKLLLHHKKRGFSEFSEMDASMITEIGNILISSYLTALSQLMNYKIKQSVPALALDMANAILSIPATEFSTVSDRVLFIESEFGLAEASKTDISGCFMFIPSAT